MPKLSQDTRDKIIALRGLGHSYRVITETLNLKTGQAYEVIRRFNGGRLIKHIGPRKWNKRTREVPPPNAVPWATKDRLMARR